MKNHSLYKHAGYVNVGNEPTNSNFDVSVNV